jgi:glyoxylase-like metal-dependent hydrolase (beta-lactamase superfamily II)
VQTSRHGDHLIKLTRMGAVNAYLVQEEDGLTVVDTMIGGSADGILEAARAAGGQIVRVTITHGHLDHVGSLEALVERLPDAEVVFPAREARLLRGDRSRESGEPRDPPGDKPWSKGAIRPLDTRPGREVVAGDRIGSLEIVAAPGHSPGQVALLDTRDRTLIAGDAYASLGGLAVTSKLNPRFPLPALATWDKPTALATARALRGLNPSRLAVGHGQVLEAPGAAMDRAIAAAAG